VLSISRAESSLLQSTLPSILLLRSGPLPIYFSKRTSSIIKIIHLDLLILLFPFVFLLRLLLLLLSLLLNAVQVLEPTLEEHNFLVFQVSANRACQVTISYSFAFLVFRP
jgi:hypothetical protein